MVALFVSLHAVVELSVGRLHEDSVFLKPLIHVIPVLPMAPLDVHLNPFGDKLQLVPQALD